MSQQWHYTANKDVAVKEDDIKRATIDLRYRFIQRSQGTKDDLLIRKLFEEFDENRNQNWGPYDLDLAMKKMGLNVGGAVT